MNTDLVISLFAFAVLGVGWVAFAVALLRSPDTLHRAWCTFRTLPLVIQILVALLALPLWLGLWIWEQPWPRWFSLPLVCALALWTIFTFFPRLT